MLKRGSSNDWGAATWLFMVFTSVVPLNRPGVGLLRMLGLDVGDSNPEEVFRKLEEVVNKPAVELVRSPESPDSNDWLRRLAP